LWQAARAQLDRLAGEARSSVVVSADRADLDERLRNPAECPGWNSAAHRARARRRIERGPILIGHRRVVL
ncbi:MAG: hypothetical protein ACK5PP_19000, partial [Acidimicrobiales bacterium]